MRKGGDRIRRLITFAAALAILASIAPPVDYPTPKPAILTPPLPPWPHLTSRHDEPTPAPKHIAKPAPKPPEPRILYAGTATITAYTGIDGDQRGDDITASGARATPWLTVAAWGDIPFGSRVEVTYGDGHTREYIVQDRGGSIGFAHLDLYIGHSNVDEAITFGRQTAQIKIYAPR